MAIEKAGDEVSGILDDWTKRGEDAEPEPDSDPVELRIANRTHRVLFGNRFADKTFDNYQTYGPQETKMQHYLEACRKFVNNLKAVKARGNTLVFVGNSGTGKNHLVYSIAREILKAGYQIEVRTVLEIMREIKTSWDLHEQKEQEIIDRYSSADFFILEEIGIQYGSPTEKIYLFEILDRRYKACLPTILTSNLTEMEFRDFLDFNEQMRIWDRLSETGMILHFDWASYRQKKE